MSLLMKKLKLNQTTKMVIFCGLDTPNKGGNFLTLILKLGIAYSPQIRGLMNFAPNKGGLESAKYHKIKSLPTPY